MKKQLTVRVEPLILDKIRDIVYWNPDMSMNSFIEMTLEEVVKKFDDVQKRPTDKLKCGRKVK